MSNRLQFMVDGVGARVESASVESVRVESVICHAATGLRVYPPRDPQRLRPIRHSKPYRGTSRIRGKQRPDDCRVSNRLLWRYPA